MRFAHLGDTHIRNLKYHYEYRAVFNKLYQKLRDLKVDYIIHCGDIAHTKTQISPEFVDLCSDFLKNLADIAPTYVILGNHDGNLRNSSRQDALTPIVNALGHQNLYLLKNSGEVSLGSSYVLNVLSVFDTDNWCKPSDSNAINIALYHGSISGVKTDIGWVMEHGENDISIFNNFDYGFLGDIHKTNQILNKQGTIRYCGSTVQQNFGETNDKGFLLWDIEDKKNFTCKHYSLENPKPFITIKLTPKGRIPNKLEVQKGARIRLLSENNLPLRKVRKAADAAKSRFKPESITYLNRAMGERGNVEDLTNSLVKEDLRDLGVQEELIKEYLIDYQPEDSTLEQVYKMNRKYASIIEGEEEVSRNINWKLKKIEWDNLFNYAEGNSISFKNFNGIVGVFGKNFSGKSSIIDSLLYVLFNTTSKNNRKNINIINQNKDGCRGYVEIDIGSKTYKIERTSSKYFKNLKGKKTQEAKTDVEFSVYDNVTDEEKSLNGNTRNETDKNIRKVFGTIEDFFMTSMASQLDSLAYINEGSTRRKEILAKFLDLEVFEKKFKKVKEDFLETKVALKRLSDRDYELEKKEARTELARNETEISVNERACSDLEKEMSLLSDELASIEYKIDSIPAEIIDIKKVRSLIDNCITERKQSIALANDKEKEKVRYEEVLNKIKNFIDGFDIQDVREKKQDIEKYEKQIQEIEEKHKILLQKKTLSQQKIDNFKDVPCGTNYQERCGFVKGAYRAINNLKADEVMINQLTLAKKTNEKLLSDMVPDKVNEYISKYEQVLEKHTDQKNHMNVLLLEIEKNKAKIIKLDNILADLQKKEEEYSDNQEAIENLESLLTEKTRIGSEIKKIKCAHENCKKDLLNLYRANGSLDEKYNQVLSEEEEFNRLETESTVSDLFMRCMHPNGISYDIIKKRLPLINDEISKILTNIVDFEVFFENEEKKLDILIKHSNYDARPIEMGSGAEKTIAAVAIRLALLNVSTLPKGDIFVLDEPGTALDADNMEGFIRILDMIKLQFKTVLLISHLDSLKDVVDQQVIIDKVDGYASVNE